VLFVSCLSVWEVHPEHINCSTGDQWRSSLLSILSTVPLPAAFTWLHLYLEKIRCGLAVIALLKLFVLQPWSYTRMFCLVNTDFDVDAVERMCTVHPLVHTTQPMISPPENFLYRAISLCPEVIKIKRLLLPYWVSLFWKIPIRRGGAISRCTLLPNSNCTNNVITPKWIPNSTLTT
jgi:hypothetical protein